MRSYWIAFQLWAATIFCCSAIVVGNGIFSADLSTVMFGLSVFLGAACITWPILIPMAALIRITAKLPYSPSVRVCWLAFMIAVLISLCLMLLSLIFYWMDGNEVTRLATFTCVVFFLVMFFVSGTLKKYYSQQTTSNIKS